MTDYSASETENPSLEPQAHPFSPPQEKSLPFSPFYPSVWKGSLLAFFSLLSVFLMMAHNQHLTLGVPIGACLLIIATGGILHAIGTLYTPSVPPTHSVSLSKLKSPLGFFIAALLSFWGALVGAVHGPGYPWCWGILILLSFTSVVITFFQLGVRLGPWKEDEYGIFRPFWKRHGFWLITTAGVLYLPTLGAFSLWDPWESHYGEVAREVLARDDWISLWWAQDGWFWSKPVLNFWVQALMMASTGVHYEPDQVLRGIWGASAHPEWAMRIPHALLSILSVYLLYKGVARVFGRNTAFLGGFALLTTPQWYFITHQIMTDMLLVGCMASGMGLLLMGLHTPADALAKSYEITHGKRTFHVSSWHLAIGAILLATIPQILYLFSRHTDLVISGEGSFGLHLHWDEFTSGSHNNCTLPGNEPCSSQIPASVPRSARGEDTLFTFLQRLFVAFEPVMQGLLWSCALGLLLFINIHERRQQAIYYLGVWFFAALATLGKGPAGFVLPLSCVLVYGLAQKQWHKLLQLKLGSGLLIITVVAIPWYIAMFVRHGPPFIDRLIFHDMINRAFAHVHDTNEGDDISFRFYIWQLGYALFPWSGLAPFGLTYWLRSSASQAKEKTDVAVLLGMWAFLAFFLFASMGTKFHHYISPVLPPTTMLIGIVLSSCLDRGRITWFQAAEGAASPPKSLSSHESLMMGVACISSAIFVGLIGRDLIVPKQAGFDHPGAIRFVHLFTYNYRRPWPTSLDFSQTLMVFTAVASLLSIGLAIPRTRIQSLVAFYLFSFIWALWGLNSYMLKTAPHWGQREVIETYYRARKNQDELLVAYQMNWKGENFYTGNRIPAFVSTRTPFTNWLQKKREENVKVMFFITERNRAQWLRSEVKPKSYEELTSASLCNKFILIRTEL
ncbi:glycosyltransferase family 39 protein [Pajaroellobacter abortibovis]|uniref:Glycosyltransferase RgtA/B/C/D-like domain-containing protein n=1 Tax=Pajaroellobacter abortibovis TaxID=1882918 RepID=A0A1L6MWQ8_9BACT|nr:glycosyltransferase family 39 protein [Pajaroellobacter abortibovis]APR99894.1 hypothetical protein BCY86_03775 [Pajaroellobacter abortibovis]